MEKKKNLMKKILDKIDKNLEKKSKQKSCCCCSDDEEGCCKE
jgi:hypothetical protein